MIILACNYDRGDGAFWNVWEFIEQRAKHKHFSGLYRGYFFVTDAIFFTQNVDPLSQKRWEFWSLNPLLLLAWSLIPWNHCWSRSHALWFQIPALFGPLIPYSIYLLRPYLQQRRGYIQIAIRKLIPKDGSEFLTWITTLPSKKKNKNSS